MTSCDLIVIGGSAGGLEALSAFLPALPTDFSIPIAIVIHLPADRKSLLAELLSQKCQIKVVEARDKQSLEPGFAYIAPPDYHLLIERDKSLSLSVDDAVMYSRPSIDVLFETAADALDSSVMGIVLSGANGDGARGLHQILKAGGKAIVQDRHQASSETMPVTALDMNPDALEVPLNEIANILNKIHLDNQQN